MKSVRQRILLMSVISLIALAVAAVMLTDRFYRDYKGASATYDALGAAVAAGELIHAMQTERGASSGFLQSQGVKFADQLPAIRARTDAALGRFSEQGKALSGAGLTKLDQAVLAAGNSASGLAPLRARVDGRSIGVGQAVADYTATVDALLGVIGQAGGYTSDPDNLRRVVAYLSLVRAKEQAGLERAMVTVAFTTNSVSADQFKQILEHVHKQDAYLELFSSFATRADSQALRDVLASPAAKTAQGMLDTLVARSATGGFGIMPEAWFKAMTVKIDALHGIEGGIAATIARQAGQTASREHWRFILYVVSSPLILLGLLAASLVISASVARPLQVQVAIAEEIIATRDLTRQIPTAGPEEVARAGDAFNRLIVYFRETIADLSRSSDYIRQVSTTLSASGLEMKASAAAQSDATSVVAAAVEQSSVSIGETASHTESVAGLVDSARASTEKAIQVMDQTVEHMKDIAARIGSAADNVTDLKASSSRIGGIVAVIREIAEQTNLLALNAAIEAARAGEQGRGFAVVADEVRKLAERATASTREIAQVIEAMQNGVDASVESMASATRIANDSMALVGETEAALARIDKESLEVDDSVRSISLALKEQNTAIRQVAASVEKIAQMTERNDAAAENAEALAEEMQKLATALNQSIAQFRT